jgi:hypothetical protein
VSVQAGSVPKARFEIAATIMAVRPTTQILKKVQRLEAAMFMVSLSTEGLQVECHN